MDTNETATMAELFDRDPLGLSKQDITTNVESLRSQRHRFLAGAKAAGTPAKKVSKVTKAQADAKKVTGDLDLGDLF